MTKNNASDEEKNNNNNSIPSQLLMHHMIILFLSLVHWRMPNHKILSGGALVSAEHGVGAGQDRWHNKKKEKKKEHWATPQGQGLVDHPSKNHP